MQVSMLQAYISQWHRETFGVTEGQVEGMVNHTIEECDELKDDLSCYNLLASGEYKETHKQQALEEFADIFILMSALATKWDTNLESYILEKMIKNKKREWSAPDENGVVRHTKEG